MVASPREVDARRIDNTGHQKQEMLIQCMLYLFVVRRRDVLSIGRLVQNLRTDTR
jgi:hypothetical protein